MKSWQPPLFILGTVLLIVAGFAAGGPGFGIMLAGFVMVGLVIFGLLMIPNDPIGVNQHPELVRRLLVVTTFPVEDPDTIQTVANEIEFGAIEPDTEVRLLTPASSTFLDRWATDFRAARQRAQRDLVISVASLTLAGVKAGARVGDEDLVQAVEDELVTYQATRVILITRRGKKFDEAADTLRERLRPEFRHITLTEY